MLLLAGLAAFSSCAAVPDARPPHRPEPSTPPTREPAPEPAPAPVPAPKRTEPPPAPSPRQVASRHLTEEARILLENGKPDEAIRTLERAVNLNPTHGPNFYYLSEAWMMKKDLRQAKEFNRLALRYLGNDPLWGPRVSRQAERLRKESGR